MKRGQSFKGIWISKSILELPDLNLRQVVILSDIASLSSGNKRFFKSNETIARECRASPATVKRDLNRLEALGFIKRAHHDGVRFIGITSRVNQMTDKAHEAQNPGRTDPMGGSQGPTSNTVTNTVISTFQRKHIDGGRFNEFHSNDELQKAMDGWLNHLRNLGKEMTQNSVNQTWLTLFQESDGKPLKAIRTIQFSITNNWKSLHAPPERLSFNGGRPKLDLEEAMEWASKSK